MTNFNKQNEEVKDSLDWEFYSLSYIQRTCRNWYEFMTSFPELNLRRMPFTLNSISRILRCYSYIFHWRDTTYKLFTPLGGAIKSVELIGNQRAQQTSFWSDKVIQVRSYPLSLAMIKGIPVPEYKLKQVEQFVANKLEGALKYQQQQAHITYNYRELQKLERHGLDLRLAEECHELLRSLKLPITSAHGDLHIENMILVDQEIRIIDWSMYNPNGSFVTDYIHFYNFAEAVRNNESWTVSIQKDQDFLRFLAQRVDTEPVLLKAIYTLNRIAAEASQFTNTSLLPVNQIDKYNSVLNHIVTSIKQNV